MWLKGTFVINASIYCCAKTIEGIAKKLIFRIPFFKKFNLTGSNLILSTQISGIFEILQGSIKRKVKGNWIISRNNEPFRLKF